MEHILRLRGDSESNPKLRSIISRCNSADEKIFSAKLLLAGPNREDWLFVYERIPELRKEAGAKIWEKRNEPQ